MKYVNRVESRRPVHSPAGRFSIMDQPQFVSGSNSRHHGWKRFPGGFAGPAGADTVR